VRAGNVINYDLLAFLADNLSTISPFQLVVVTLTERAHSKKARPQFLQRSSYAIAINSKRLHSAIARPTSLDEEWRHDKDAWTACGRCAERVETLTG